MRRSAPFPILFFAGAAHFMHHVVVALYLTLVLVLAREWEMGYADLIALWTLGSLLVGLGAPLAGWLGDRWGETRTLIVLFFGLGLSSVFCGLVEGPLALQAALGVMGLFGAIYHPVGTAWIVKHATLRGRAVASVGICGSFGVAAGPVVAAFLADLWGWRAGFVVPGIVTALLGIALAWFYVTGRIADRADDAHPVARTAPERGDLRRVFVILAATMTLTLIAVTALMTALPKLIEREIGTNSEGLIGIGLAVGAIHLLGASAQFVGGHFADRGVAKRAYLLSFVGLALVFPAVGLASGLAVAAGAIAAMFLFEGIAPIETLLIARYAPSAQRGLVFGVRHALSIVGAPAGVALVSTLYDPVTGFSVLMYVLAGTVALCALATLALPADRAGREANPLSSG